MGVSKRAKARFKIMSASEKNAVKKAVKLLFDTELMGVKRMRILDRRQKSLEDLRSLRASNLHDKRRMMKFDVLLLNPQTLKAPDRTARILKHVGGTVPAPVGTRIPQADFPAVTAHHTFYTYKEKRKYLTYCWGLQEESPRE